MKKAGEPPMSDSSRSLRSSRLSWLTALLLVTAVAACTSSSSDDAASLAGGEKAPIDVDDRDQGTPNEPGGVAPGGGSTGKGGSTSGGGPVSGGPSQGASGSGTAGPGQGEPSAPPPSKEPLPDAEAAIATCAELDPEKPATFYLSADDSNSMASPTMARHALRQGYFQHSAFIRTYEFLNYYNVAFEKPAEGTLAIVPQVREGDTPGTLSLQIGVQSAVSAGVRRPATLTFVLDTSGSMQGAAIDNQRASMQAIAKKLLPGDIVSIVTWNTENRVELSGHAISGPNDPALLAVVNKLSAGGGTDLNGGLTAGYKLAQDHFGANRINRVVVISDGMANVGVTEEKVIGQLAQDNDSNAQGGIYLVGIAVGESFNDTLLNVVTDAGNGAYLYVDSQAEADKMLADRFEETFQVAARDVRVKADFPWYFQIKQFFGEEYSTDPAKVKPQHLAPGDAMVFNQVLAACDAAEIKDADPFSFTVSWSDPISYEAKSVSKTVTLGELRAGSKHELEKGEAIVAYAETLKIADATKRHAAAAAALAKVVAADPDGKDAALVEIKELLGLVQK
jgi:Ca-activated chloride channel homolog